MDALRERVRSRSCTCVMVAHRMSTLRQCDKIVFMADGGGSVAGGEAGEAGGAFAREEGTHEELMALVRRPMWPCLVLAPCDSSALRGRQAMRGCQGEIAAWPLCNRRAENTRNSTRKWFGKKKVVASRKRAKRARRRAKLAAVAEEARVALAGDEHGQVLQWTLANGCEWDLRTCSDAASRGRSEAVALAEHFWCCQRLLSECSARANTVK